MKKLDLVALSLITCTLLALAGVVYFGNHIPIQIACSQPSPCVQVGPYGAVVFEFSRSVQPSLVEKRWQTDPPMSGKWEWQDDRHGRWVSTQAIPGNQTVLLIFNPGPVGQNGEPIVEKDQWKVVRRAPSIVATRQVGDGDELFSFSMDGSSDGIQITHSNGRIFDFQPSPDGESVVYSAFNDQKGIDLWIVQRDGSNPYKLLDCGADHCTTPAWSPVTQELAYTRESAGLDPNGPLGAPRVYLYDFKSGQSSPLFNDAQKIGYGPVWSPDGQWLSIWNGSQGGILVANRKSGDSFMLDSASGVAGSWGPDSQSLYYSNTVTNGDSFVNVILKADVQTRTETTFLGGMGVQGNSGADDPVSDPKGGWVAVTIQPDSQQPDRNLSLVDSNGESPIILANDPSTIPGFYSWSPDGDRLVYELDNLSGSGAMEEIWIWDQKGGAKKITTDARFPKWLP